MDTALDNFKDYVKTCKLPHEVFYFANRCIVKVGSICNVYAASGDFVGATQQDILPQFIEAHDKV